MNSPLGKSVIVPRGEMYRKYMYTKTVYKHTKESGLNGSKSNSKPNNGTGNE